MMNKFLDLLGTSVIVQGILTLSVVGTWLYLMAIQVPVPSELSNIVGLVVGFYFGSKYQNAMRNSRPEAVK